jgi:hypothetical protein
MSEGSGARENPTTPGGPALLVDGRDPSKRVTVRDGRLAAFPAIDVALAKSRRHVFRNTKQGHDRSRQTFEQR